MPLAQIHEHRILGLVSVQTPVVAGIQSQSGVPLAYDPVVSIEADEVQSCFSAFSACLGGLGDGGSFSVVDPGALGASDDLYRSFSSCLWDRKYF